MAAHSSSFMSKRILNERKDIDARINVFLFCYISTSIEELL